MKMKILCIISFLLVFNSCMTSEVKTEEISTENVDSFLNHWHQAIADKDSNKVFSVLADDFHYFGTDSFENWNKEAFEQFALPLFRAGKSWDFKVTHAEYFQQNNLVWTYQMLDTWMGPCRGTALVSKNSQNNLQLHFYHLSFVVPNDQMNSVIELISSEKN